MKVMALFIVIILMPFCTSLGVVPVKNQQERECNLTNSNEIMKPSSGMILVTENNPIILGEIGCDSAKRYNIVFKIKQVENEFFIVGLRLWVLIISGISLLIYEIVSSNSLLNKQILPKKRAR